MSRNLTGQPSAAAKVSSKHSRRNSLKSNNEQVITQIVTSTRIWKSLITIDAVLPYINDSKPAALPSGIVWITPRIATPAPKNTLSTIPIAASSLIRVCSRIKSTAAHPITPVMAAPANNIGNDFPSPPSATASMKDKPTPGSVACESVSPIKERLRNNRKPPMSPQAQPNNIVQITTRRVL